MPHFISWQQFEDIKRQNYLNEAVKRQTFQAKPRKHFDALATLKLLSALDLREQVDEMMTAKPKKYFKPDGYVRKTEICKNCGRRVKVINGQMISHRFREGGKQEWCEKPLD